MNSILELSDTLRRVSRSGMKPGDLVAAVKARHPTASKKDVVRAAFFAVTDLQAVNSSQTADLHAFAMSERLGNEDEETSQVSAIRYARRLVPVCKRIAATEGAA